jgi:hypothetical protein
MIPRGELDIEWPELGRGLMACFSSETPATVERRISAEWDASCE